MTNHLLKDILDELYSLSPELRKQEDAIVRIIEKMQQNRPKVDMNGVFREELKARILGELRKLHTPPVSKESSWFSRPWFL